MSLAPVDQVRCVSTRHCACVLSLLSLSVNARSRSAVCTCGWRKWTGRHIENEAFVPETGHVIIRHSLVDALGFF